MALGWFNNKREASFFIRVAPQKELIISLSLSLSLSLFVCVCVSRARKHTHTHTHTHSQWLVAVAESNLETQTRDAKTRAHAVIFSSAYSRHSARLTVPAETALRFLHQRVFFSLESFLPSLFPSHFLPTVRVLPRGQTARSLGVEPCECRRMTQESERWLMMRLFLEEARRDHTCRTTLSL